MNQLKNKAKPLLQVMVLTTVLVFSGLLIVGSFDAPSWASDEHYGGDTYFGVQITRWVDIHLGGSHYYNNP